MMLVFSSFFLCLYIALIAYFIIGNRRYQAQKIEHSKIKVSLIIPFRNEADKLPALLEALFDIDYPKSDLDIVFVDDHSDDKGAVYIQEQFQQQPKAYQWQLIGLNEVEGKKNAIKAGVNAAKHELIVTTDADCIMHAKWLQTMSGYFAAENPDILLGPTMLYNTTSFFQKLQQLEFAALMAVTAGAVAQKKAFMANGANLAFRKETYLKFNDADLKFNQASGDDVFLLHAIKKNAPKSAKIAFANDRLAVVETMAISSFFAFIQQRLRWGAKAKYYTDKFSIFVSLLVLMGNLALLTLFLMAWLNAFYWYFFAVYLLLKWGVDTILLYSISAWRTFKISPFHSFLLSFFYPFYFILLALLSLHFKAQWKGRKI